MADYRDFKEIAHCGGKMTFTVEQDSNGEFSISSGWTHSRPTPAAIAGIYADLNNGFIVGDFRFGGIGMSFDPPPPAGALPIFLGSDTHAKWGHECPNCRAYFRSEHHPALYPITCAYCGLKGPTHTFRTTAQRNYVRLVIYEVGACVDEVPPGTKREIVIDMDAAADQKATDALPEFYYGEQAQQTEFNCLKCGGYNDVRGRFAYCGSCGWRNNHESFRKQINEVRERMNAGNLTPEGALREAVSAFDSCCRDFAQQIRQRIPMKSARRAALEKSFYDIDGAAILALKQVDIDLTRGFTADEAAFVKKMTHRRHVHEHLGGVADQEYLVESGDTSAKIGDLLRENQDTAHRFANLLNKMVGNLDADFHEIFPPTEWPIGHHNKGGDRGHRRIW